MKKSFEIEGTTIATLVELESHALVLRKNLMGHLHIEVYDNVHGDIFVCTKAAALALAAALVVLAEGLE